MRLKLNLNGSAGEIYEYCSYIKCTRDPIEFEQSPYVSPKFDSGGWVLIIVEAYIRSLSSPVDTPVECHCGRK